MAAFFIPGLTGSWRDAEEAYLEMRRAVELDMGRRPSERRILQLWSRRGGADCLTEVGRPDPVHGGTVMAIFDLGSHYPFVVHRQPPAAGADDIPPDEIQPEDIREVLGCHAYSVLEFES